MHPLPPELVVPPAFLPVALATAKAHCRVDHDEDDPQLEAAIAAAVGHLDGYTGILGRALMRQSWRESFRGWPGCRWVELRLAPVLDIASVTMRGADGAPVTLDPTSYRLVSGASRPTLLLTDAALLPLVVAPDAVTVTYRAGYSADDAEVEQRKAVPAAIRSAILLMVGDLYRFRSTATLGSASSVPMSATVDRLLAPFRRVSL